MTPQCQYRRYCCTPLQSSRRQQLSGSIACRLSVAPSFVRSIRAMTEDPGWWPVLRDAPFAVIPTIVRLAAKRRKWDGLTSLRLHYVSFLVSHVWILLVLAALDFNGEGGISLTISLLLLAGFAVSAYVGLTVIRRQRMQVATSLEAAGQYRSWTFLGIAFASSIALIGFVLVFLGESPMPYYVGLLLAIPAFYLAAPTTANLARRQAELAGDIDLVGGLVGLTA